ncbi:hypothetical protein RI367_008857, partial [Sorochytrium milnesiophthora]
SSVISETQPMEVDAAVEFVQDVEGAQTGDTEQANEDVQAVEKGGEQAAADAEAGDTIGQEGSPLSSIATPASIAGEC